ncbi:innexin unc-9-like [Symsagittifera roscoffensis]|uniref:innexin unc-9-like n=1 Tax=Symsagittifera roscoffensis TaxID=84072 RepID=UPI00307C7A0A
MVVSIIFDVITGSKQGNDGDFNDRLNHRYSAIVLAFCAIFAMSTQLIGSPLNCWAPGNFHPGWVMYADNVCFVNKTYYIADEDHVTLARKEGDTVYVEFYQWYPVILVLMGVLFYAPQMFWTGMLGSYEIDMNKMVNTVDNCELIMKPEDRKNSLMDLAGFLDKHLEAKKRLSDINKKNVNIVSKALFKCRDKDSGASMGTYYLIVKIAMVVNVVVQIYGLNWIIGPGTWKWGFEVLGCILSGQQWTDTWRFPMTAFCDFQRHEAMGTRHQETVQCVLGVNLYNEKIFLFVWCWLYFMLVMNLMSVFNWISTLFASNSRFRWIEKHILMGNRTKGPDQVTYIQENEENRRALWAFVMSFLKPDGVFMLRLIAANTTSINMTDLICNLWHLYTRKDRVKERFPKLPNITSMEEHTKTK